MNLQANNRKRLVLYLLGTTALGVALLVGVVGAGAAETRASAPGAPGAAYSNAPVIAPIGVRIGKYMDVPEASKGPPIDPRKGYRTEQLGGGLYLVADGAYQSMFLVYEAGVVAVDAPPTHAAHIRHAIEAVTPQPITHLVYSHAHTDHIGGARELGAVPIVIAHEETKKLLARANDPARPLPTVTFSDRYTLRVGSQVLELSYHGNGHEPGNIFIHAPAQRTLMVVDVVFPGWMPWRRFAVAHDVGGVFAQVEELRTFDFDKLVSGHVSRIGTKADVELQWEFMSDLKATVSAALKSTQLGEELDPSDLGNPWAVYDNYIDRVVIQAVNELTPRWSKRLAGFDVYIWDQCYSMEQSLRID